MPLVLQNQGGPSLKTLENKGNFKEILEHFRPTWVAMVSGLGCYLSSDVQGMHISIYR